jgi:hypothetical protein
MQQNRAFLNPAAGDIDLAMVREYSLRHEQPNEAPREQWRNIYNAVSAAS